MSSIHLSFKEWPFLPFNQIPQTQQLKSSSLTKNKIEIIKSMVSLDLVSSINFSNINSLKQSMVTQQNNKTNFNNKKQLYHLSSWGQCKLFACTYASCLCIYANDEKECLTPIFMFSPFERFKIGKITKNHPKKTLITAIGWSKGHLQPCLSQPLLAVCSDKGHLLVYNINLREIIGKIRFNEPIISILWSSFKLNRFYAGTNTGHFYICEIEDKSIQIIKMFEFKALSEKSTTTDEPIPKSIDFITQDDVNGYTIAISSKDGSVGYLTNLDDIKQTKLHVFQNLQFNCFNETDKKRNIVINFFSFYPNSQDFVTIAANVSTYIISISKGVLIPFIQTPNCKFISIIDNENNKVIIGDDNDLTVWDLVENSWVRSNVLKIGEKFGLTEILTFSKLNNKILLTTASNWLTEIEYKRNKLFITKRIKLINGIPIDYDIGNGSIAMLTNNNSISFTQFTPESIIKSKFLEDNQDSSNSNSQIFQIVDDSNINDDDDDSDLYNEVIPYKNIEVNNSLGKSTSLTFEIGSDSSKPFKHILNKEKIESIKTSDSEISFVRSESDNLMQHAGIKYDGNESLNGTINSFVYSFNIPLDSVIKQIKWISPQKLIAWGRKAFYLIDLQTNEVKSPLSKKFDKKCNFITQLIFSKTRKIICLILNNIEAFLINTESNFEIIKSINFSEIIHNDCDCLLGSISPNEDRIIFVCKNTIFFSNLDNNDNSINKIYSSLEFNASFVSWKKRGVLIGTEKGNVFLITNKKIIEILKNTKIKNKDVKVVYDSSRSGKKKLGSVKLITSCNNDGLIILDSNDQGIVISNGVKMIADNIKSFKKCSNDTILVRLQNHDKLIVLNIFVDFSPPPPPIDFSVNNEVDELFQNNSIISQLFLTNEQDPSVSLRNNVYLLNQIISMHEPFHSLSSKTFLKLGFLEKARNLLLKTDPNDKEYINNMMIAALYESSSNESNSVQLVLDSLLSNNLTDLAVDILLITKNAYLAVETLFKLGRCKDAYCILMLNEFKKDSDAIVHLIKEIADYFFTKKEDAIFGLKLLASFGCIEEFIDQLSLYLH